MRSNLLIIFVSLFSFVVYAGTRPQAEILDCGIYLDTHQFDLAYSNSPTGRLLVSNHEMLLKQTVTVPAKISTLFGFGFVVHGRRDGAPIQLRLVYLFPDMIDPSSRRKSNRCEVKKIVKPEDNNSQMLWNFTEPFELVTGKWTFQIYEGNELILYKNFNVVKAGT